MTTPQPLPIADFLDTLANQGRRVLPGSLRWMPHPTKKGREVAAVIVTDSDQPGPSGNLRENRRSAGGFSPEASRNRVA